MDIGLVLSEIEMRDSIMMKKISASEIPDRVLIVRILENHKEKKSRINEMIHLTCQYKTIVEIVMAEVFLFLENNYNQSEIKKLMELKEDRVR